MSSYSPEMLMLTRRRLGMDQEQFAKILGVTRS
ncbi:MAG: hypothetical protein RL376_1966, partial [Verrucomicrobiota bacterium]